MNNNGRPYQHSHQPPPLSSSSPYNYQPIRPPPTQFGISSNRPPSLSRRESSKPATPSQIRPPQLPDWARPPPRSASTSSQNVPLVKGDSRASSLISLPSPSRPQATAVSREQSPGSQFTVQLKSSPLKPSLYQKVDDAAIPAPVLKQSRKRPQPGAMGVVNMFASMTNEGATASALIGFPSTPGTVNRRGRPKGWKPGMSYAAIRGNPPPGSSTGLPRGKRPTTVHDVTRRQYLRSKADFVPFVCEWAESETGQCPAELQNLDTLRRHLFVVHVVDKEEENADEEDSFEESGQERIPEQKSHSQRICYWGTCASRDPQVAFTSEDALDNHIEAHLQALAWHAGDGHQNKGMNAIKQDAGYLKNKAGDQVTPSVKEQQLETDQQRKERKRRLRILETQRDENAPDEEEFTKQTLGTEEVIEE